jgi:hypothetical protein
VVERGEVVALSSELADFTLPGGEALAVWLLRKGPHVALLTYGSNPCPGRMHEKFDRGADGFAVLPAVLCGAARAWSANRSSRGSVPATLVDAPAWEEPAHILLMPASQAPLMDRSEGRGGPYYSLVRLEQAMVRLPDGTLWSRPLTYLGHADRGPLVVDDLPVRCADNSQERAAQLIVDRGGDVRDGDRFLPPHREIPPAEPLLEAALPDREGPLARWLAA